MEDMIKNRIPQVLYRVAQSLELAVGALLIVAILISFTSIFVGLQNLLANVTDQDAFSDFLAGAFNVIIGIEFLKMLCRHNLGSVVEVLLFAIAREMVINHASATETLIIVVAIAVLFVIRKYLFVPNVDLSHHHHHPVEEKKERAQDERAPLSH